VNREEKIRSLVRRAVHRSVGRHEPTRREASGRLVTQQEVERIDRGGEIVLPPGAIVTPLARQSAVERRVSLVAGDGAPRVDPMPAAGPETAAGSNLVALGADHGGFEFKELLKAFLEELGYGVLDCGTDGPGAVDYPDYALAVAQLVAQGNAWRGIVVDGAGIGSCMAANKVPGVRAAMCYDLATTINSRSHNDANVLTLGAGMIGPELGRQIVRTWLETDAEGGRHARRVAKIMSIEQRYLDGGEGEDR
jgi:ribose 5-phosphate isomerase B